jgi:hypothetical protein
VIHIYNGDVVAELARRAELPGEHLAFREALANGPVPADATIETRARFLAEEYDQKLLRVRHDLIEQEEALSAAMTHDEIVLWFEHDLFCVANLLSLLVRFAAHRRLTLIWNPQPLSQADLAALFESRSAVTPSMLRAAPKAWAAFTSDDPMALNRFAKRQNADFPFLRDGMRLHASRFPSLRNGLGAVEQRMLEIVVAGAGDFRSLFDRFNVDVPRFGFGDGDILRTLRRMATAAVPLLTMDEAPGSPPKALFRTTPAAENVLRGDVDYARVNPPSGWLGGVNLTQHNYWRWDERKHEITPSPSAVS